MGKSHRALPSMIICTCVLLHHGFWCTWHRADIRRAADILGVWSVCEGVCHRVLMEGKKALGSNHCLVLVFKGSRGVYMVIVCYAHTHETGMVCCFACCHTSGQYCPMLPPTVLPSPKPKTQNNPPNMSCWQTICPTCLLGLAGVRVWSSACCDRFSTRTHNLVLEVLTESGLKSGVDTGMSHLNRRSNPDGCP